MTKFWQNILNISLLISSRLTNANPHPRHTYSPIRTIYEFPNETWVENIAVRSNGNLLLTIITSPDLYELNPFNPTAATLLATFPSSTSVLGITEASPDIFAVVVGNWSTTTFSTTNGSYSIWSIDFRHAATQTGRPSVTKITDIPEASFPNGMTLLAVGSPYLLIADSGIGVVWRLNWETSQYEIVLDSPLMKPVPTPPFIGINGIHVFDSFVYFTNSFQGLFARVPVYLSGPEAGSAAGGYEVVAYVGPCDDFAFDKEGNAYIAQDPGDALELVTRDGKVSILAGNVNSTLLVGDTSNSFGKTERDESILYVVTNGGIAGRVPGTQIVGGKVIAVDVKGLENVASD